jgi:hypothetical protein
MIPSPLSNEHNGATLKVNSPHHKKQSILPDNAAERLVHQGIKFHEAGKLEQATEMFKQASAMDLPIAMFLYGVSIRHGWVINFNSLIYNISFIIGRVVKRMNILLSNTFKKQQNTLLRTWKVFQTQSINQHQKGN